VGDPGSQNKGPGKIAVEESKADSGMTLCSTRIWISVDWREERATSKPVFNPDDPWKHVTNLPPNPKLNTGILAEDLPSGSFNPIREGDGAYGV
jgi:hypothetical protein